MSNTEEERHRLYRALEGAIGQQETTTLMRHLPPKDWTELVTVRDLEHQSEMLRGEVRVTGANLTAVFHAEMRRQTQFTIAANATIAGVFVALASLI